MVGVGTERKLNLILILTLCILCEVCVTNCQVTSSSSSSSVKPANIRSLERKIKDKLLVGKYDKDIRPGGGVNGSEPTDVTVNLLLRSISNIDDFKMEYSVQFTLREEWHDPRLRFEGLEGAENLKALTIVDTSRVWMPDVFFINEKEGKLHSIIKPNAYIRISPNGTLLFSIRISETLSCPMHLSLFPMDSQTCSITMASYSWTTEDLTFKWKDISDPVQVPDLSLPRFNLEDITTYSYDRVTNTGNYSCLKADLYLVRSLSYYLIQMYIPSIMLVIVSWVSFYLDENAVPARTGLGITTLLTMATQSASMKTQSAAVSYTKALDVWSTTCLLFVFAALMEFAVVDYCRRYDKRKAPAAQYESSVCCKRFSRNSKKVDVTARIVFPALFFMFNMVYWVYYSIANDRDYTRRTI